MQLERETKASSTAKEHLKCNQMIPNSTSKNYKLYSKDRLEDQFSDKLRHQQL